MNTYFIETSVIVDFLRGKEKAVFAIKNLEGELVSSYFCLAELCEGVSLVKNKRRAEQSVIDFFSELDFIYGLDPEISRNFGFTRAGLKKRGKVIEDIDIFIAATCLSNDLILVTANARHFERIKNLKIIPVK